MIAIKHNDICFSTARDGANPFNLDGVKRTELPIELAATAFDFNILKKKSYDGKGREIPGHFHLERDDEDGTLIPTAMSVGNQYTPIQHKEVFEYITQKVMPELPQMKLEMAGTIHGGGIGLISAKFGDTFSFKGDESPNELRLFFNNPCNGGGRMTLGFTTVRVVCQNTLLAATREASKDGWCITHTKSAPEMTMTAIQCIQGQAVAALEMKRRCELLANVGVDTEMFEKCLNSVYPIELLPEGPARTRMEHLREKVIAQFESAETAQTFKEDNAWKLFNSFTYPIFNEDPERLAKKKRKDAAEIAYSGMTGTVAQKVRRIFDKVEQAAFAA